jgi:hypothetical protein
MLKNEFINLHTEEIKSLDLLSMSQPT